MRCTRLCLRDREMGFLIILGCAQCWGTYGYMTAPVAPLHPGAVTMAVSKLLTRHDHAVGVGLTPCSLVQNTVRPVWE